eukprot:3330468-Rhodomonas_salina.3
MMVRWALGFGNRIRTIWLELRENAKEERMGRGLTLTSGRFRRVVRLQFGCLSCRCSTAKTAATYVTACPPHLRDVLLDPQLEHDITQMSPKRNVDQMLCAERTG